MRWQHGLGQALALNKSLLFNPRGGTVSWFATPFYLLFELLGPVLEVLGYAVIITAGVLGWLSPMDALVFLALALTLGILLSSSAVMLEELSFHLYPRTRDILLLYVIAVLENFGYRQLTAIWRVQGLARWLLRRRHAWESIARTDSLEDTAETVRMTSVAPDRR